MDMKLIGVDCPGEFKYFLHLSEIQSLNTCNSHETHNIKISYRKFIPTYIFLIFFFLNCLILISLGVCSNVLFLPTLSTKWFLTRKSAEWESAVDLETGFTKSIIR